VAGMSLVCEQFTAIARARWQIFFHSLRTTRGTAELVSRIFVSFLIAGAGIGGAIGVGAAAWSFVSNSSPGWLALLLWFVFVFWQFFPVMATAFTESTDSSVFLRFPLSYRAFFLVVVAFGALDIATALGSLWLLGMLCGIAIAQPTLGLWAAIVLCVFALTNIILSRTIFAWIERWLAQRRTRELFGILFFLLVISFQLIGPLLNRYGDRSKPDVMRLGQRVSPVQQALPPGLAGNAITKLGHSPAQGFASFGLLCAYGACFLWLLNLRLRGQYRGESFSETSARRTQSRERQIVPPGWKLPGLSSCTAAILQKELLYLSRSGPMLFTLTVPVVMLTVFRFGGAGGEKNGVLAHAPNFAFPAGAAYALLVLTNLVYNNFGADAGGVQLLFALPVRFRQVVFAKNLAHLTVLALEVGLVWGAVSFLYGRPPLDVTVMTLAGLVFAAPVNFSAGNVLSIYSPKKIEFATFGRQRASQTTILFSFLVQIVVYGIAALVLLFVPHGQGYWLAATVFALLAALTITAYLIVLGRVDRMALERRESMISELCRA